MGRFKLFILLFICSISFGQFNTPLLFNIQSGITTDSLIAWYGFNSNVLDSTDNNFDGTPSNITYANDRFSQSSHSVSFNGSTSEITISDNDLWSFTDGAGNDSAFTITCWVYIVDDDRFRIISKGVSANREYYFGTTSDDFLQIILYDNGGSGTNYLLNTTDFDFNTHLNEWMFFCARYDGSETTGGLELIISDSTVTDVTKTDVSYTGMANTSTGVEIGDFMNLGSTSTNGRIDDLRIYNRKLTDQELTSIRQEGGYAP